MGIHWKTQLKNAKLELNEYKVKFKAKYIPSHLKGEKREEWINNAYLALDSDSNTIISGGGRILLFLIPNNWKKALKQAERKNSYVNYVEIRKFMFRQKVLGIDLIKYAGNEILIQKEREI